MTASETAINDYLHLVTVADWFAERGYIVAAAEYEIKANAFLARHASDRINHLTGESP